MGADTITFGTGVTGTINLNAALPTVISEITITGPGPGADLLTINSANDDAFIVDFDSTANVGGNLTLALLTVSTSDMWSAISIYGGSYDPGDGGAWLGVPSYLTLNESILRNNDSGIRTGSGAHITINRSTLTDNGQGVYFGYINSENPTTSVITNSTLTTNGVGVAFSPNSTGTITNSTISANTMAGLFFSAALPSLRAEESAASVAAPGPVAQAMSGVATLGNTILANAVPNSAVNCGKRQFDTPDTIKITDLGNNLADDYTCFPGGTNNDQVVAPGAAGLDSAGLQDHGGPTPTIALLATSPAVDTANASLCAQTGTGMVNNVDQRAISRPQQAVCDIGAFELRYANLTTSTAGTGTGTVTPNGSSRYSAESGATSASVSAAPAAGSVFSGWTLDGAPAGTANPITVVMSVDHTLVANFTLSTGGMLVNLTTTVEGSGTVTPSGTTAYAPGTEVNLSATAAPGYRFVGWVVDGGATDIAHILQKDGWYNPNLTITMNAPHTISAKFMSDVAFCDVDASTTYLHAIQELAARGIIKGYVNGCYGPNDPVMRAQLAAILVRTFEWQNQPSANVFTDQGSIDNELWHAIGILTAKGIAQGYGDGTFRPTEPVSHAQAISLITRSMVSEGYWQQQAADPALYGGVLNGTGHEADVTTYVHYVGHQIPGATAGQSWTDWNTPAARQWIAQVFWLALDSHFNVDRVP